MTTVHQNLADYLESLSSKYDFYRSIQDRCQVSLNTAINWCKLYCVPKEQKHLDALSELTGLPVENLFKRH